ncbi:MAG: heat-inducible transcriptional repressor HrcA [Bacillota bacterium]|jgi:heat-inducible transcriptional repressor
MDERKKQILHAIIKDYISTAEPVGSRAVAKKYNLGVSPATIRNEMSDLEELGYIEQPHTSAGRRPSNKGYRYYVDSLMEKETLDEKDIRLIRQFLSRQLREMDSFMRQCCQMISHLTNYTAFVSLPYAGKGKLKRIQLILLDSWQVFLIILSTTGQVSHRIITFPEPMKSEQIAFLEKMLQEKLHGLDMSLLTPTLLQEISYLMNSSQKIFSEILELMEMVLENDGDEKVFTGGVMNMLMQPEFRDIETLKTIFSLLEEDRKVKNLLSLPQDSASHVAIGDEICQEDIQNCSIVVTSYNVGKERIGAIGVLGPTRMSYSKTISLMEFIAAEISETLSHKGRI